MNEIQSSEFIQRSITCHWRALHCVINFVAKPTHPSFSVATISVLVKTCDHCGHMVYVRLLPAILAAAVSTQYDIVIHKWRRCMSQC